MYVIPMHSVSKEYAINYYSIMHILCKIRINSCMANEGLFPCSMNIQCFLLLTAFHDECI